METIKEFLDSDIYLELIKELGSDNFNKELQSVEIELLKDCLKQRQFLLEGFKCKLDSEKELVEFYKKIIEENYRDIIIWSKAFWQYSDDAIEESYWHFGGLLQKTAYSGCRKIFKGNEKIV